VVGWDLMVLSFPLVDPELSGLLTHLIRDGLRNPL
jgi:hypothetical protein